ncbi:hypothetical protein HBI44_239660 [Parastagonospora nodorum]|nr:hypothetical protein HBI44_239660 [Parastagonospora nodorum]
MFQQHRSLVECAQRILTAAKEIEQRDSNSDLVTQSRRAIAEATQELQNIVLTPSELLEHHQINYQNLSCLRWLIRFNIFNLVSADGSPMLYSELAMLAGVPLARLQSVARMAMTSGLFVEPSPGLISHSALSAPFATDESLRDWARFMTTYSAPMASGMAEATVRWGETYAKHQTAFNVSFDTELPWFDYVKATPGLPEEFAGYMRAMGHSTSGRLQHLVEGFDWASLGRHAVVVDVGGSTGQASIALAEAFPDLQLVVQDLPEVVAVGAGMRRNVGVNKGSESEVTARIEFEAHDFFDPQPVVTGAAAPAVYLLRKILHDWPFERARVICQHLADALLANRNPDAMVVIMDTILPPPGTVGHLQEAGLRVRDLTMAQCFNSKERELLEWEELLGSTSPPLIIKSWKQPLGSAMAVMTAAIKPF